jgi:hypothetical protein
MCSSDEDCLTCPTDCGVCPPGCGDGVCGPTESCGSCPLDCSCQVTGTQLAAGAGLHIEDVSRDGAYVAYLDAAANLFAVSTTGGAPVMLSTAVAKARYKGGFLFVFHGLSASGKTAASMEIFPVGGATAVATDVQVKVKTAVASDDQNHYAYARISPNGRDLVLDGTVLFADATSVHADFSADSARLVAALSYQDPGTGLQVQPVRAYPIAGGAPVTLVADGAGQAFALTPDGTAVVVAANDNGATANLALVPLAGGAATPLVTADHKGFEVTSDGATLVFSDAGALRVTSLSGGGVMTLVASGVLSIEDVSAQTVIYATAKDPTTLLETLRVVRIDGGGNVALGAQAASEGHTDSATTVGARDNIVGSAGDLEIVAVPALTRATLGSMVTKSSFPDDARVVYVDTAALRVAPVTGGSATTLQGQVSSFELVPDSLVASTRGRVAFILPIGVDAGLYITAL